MATTTVDARASRPATPAAGTRVARNLAVLAGSQVVTWTLSLGWTLFVPRALGPRGIGELTVAGAVTGVISVAAGLGVGTLMVKEIARDHNRASSLVGTVLAVRAFFFVPAVAAVVLYMLVNQSGTEQTVVLWLATATMLLGFVIAPFQSAFQGLERMEFLAYGDILTKAVTSIAGIAIVIIGFRVVGIMETILIVTAVTLLLNIWWSRGKFGIDWRIDRAQVKGLVVGSLPYWMAAVVLAFYVWIDSLMLSLMSPASVVGWYAVPTKIFNTLLFVPVILSTALLPRLSAAFREGLYTMRATGKPALELVLVLSLPLAAGSALVAQPFIATVYGSQFAQSAPVLVILAFTLPPTYFNIVANQVLIASNRQVVWTKVMIAAAIVNPLINLFLIRYFQAYQHNGAIGAALSLLTTEIGMAVAGLFVLPPMLDGGSVLRLIRGLLAAGGMALVVSWASSFGLILEATAGAFAFFCLAMMLRVLSKEEVAMLRKIVGRLFIRDNGRAGYSTSRYHGWDDITARPVR